MKGPPIDRGGCRAPFPSELTDGSRRSSNLGMATVSQAWINNRPLVTDAASPLARTLGSGSINASE
jgi:hypothetical protein